MADDNDTRLHLRMPAELRSALDAAAAADGRSPGLMARRLLEKALVEPVSVVEKAVYGHDAQRSPVTGKIYEQGSGAHPPEVQDRLAMAAAGGRLTEAQAQRIVRGTTLEDEAAAAAASLELK
jgi:hypothetical protein